jgi:hypothetical protein
MPQGGCLCGAVRYRIDAEPISSGICHCRTCRKVASAPTLPFVGFPSEALSIIRGTPVEFRSSPRVTRSFCGQCGSPLTYQTAEKADCIDIMTCSLDDPDAFPPTFHVWTDHKLAWDRLGDGLPTYRTSRSAGRG